MEIKIEQPDLELCDFTNPQHCAALCDLINEYITHPMGGVEPLSDSQNSVCSTDWSLIPKPSLCSC